MPVCAVLYLESKASHASTHQLILLGEYSLCACIKSLHSTSPLDEFMKQSSRFCFVIGQAQHGLTPFGLSGSTRQKQNTMDKQLLAALEVSTFSGFSGFFDPSNHPQAMVTIPQFRTFDQNSRASSPRLFVH
jgi:hypothetical protein